MSSGTLHTVKFMGAFYTTWSFFRFKDEKEVKKSKTVDIQSKSDGTQILSVKSSTTEDSGEYKCQATNKIGTSSSTATVTVKSKVFGKFLKNQPFINKFFSRR